MAHLDRFLPHPEQRSVHCRGVDAPPAAAVAAARRLDVGDIPGFQQLLALRAAPAVASGRSPWARGGLVDLALRFGFGLLADEDDRFVLGYIGQPWRLWGGRTVRFESAAEFVDFDGAGYVKVAADVRAAPDGTGCVLCTETRVVATDAITARRFARYWAVISPFGGLIRRSLLAAAARATN